MNPEEKQKIADSIERTVDKAVRDAEKSAKESGKSQIQRDLARLGDSVQKLAESGKCEVDNKSFNKALRDLEDEKTYPNLQKVQKLATQMLQIVPKPEKKVVQNQQEPPIPA